MPSSELTSADENDASALLAARARLTRAIEETTAHPVEADDLVEGVCSYVRLLRSEGAPPESVLGTVKAAAHTALEHVDDERRAIAVLNRVVTLCIDEYYRR